MLTRQITEQASNGVILPPVNLNSILSLFQKMLFRIHFVPTWYLVYTLTSIPPLIGARMTSTAIPAMLAGPVVCQRKNIAITCKNKNVIKTFANHFLREKSSNIYVLSGIVLKVTLS